MHFSSPEKRIWLVTDAYAIVTNPLSMVVMNHKRVYSQENARMHVPIPNNAFGGAASVILPCSQPALLLVIRGNMAKCILAGSVNAFGCASGAP